MKHIFRFRFQFSRRICITNETVKVKSKLFENLWGKVRNKVTQFHYVYDINMYKELISLRLENVYISPQKHETKAFQFKHLLCLEGSPVIYCSSWGLQDNDTITNSLKHKTRPRWDKAFPLLCKKKCIKEYLFDSSPLCQKWGTCFLQLQIWEMV